jgi:hypothetical protein
LEYANLFGFRSKQEEQIVERIIEKEIPQRQTQIVERIIEKEILVDKLVEVERGCRGDVTRCVCFMSSDTRARAHAHVQVKVTKEVEKIVYVEKPVERMVERIIEVPYEVRKFKA